MIDFRVLIRIILHHRRGALGASSLPSSSPSLSMSLASALHILSSVGRAFLVHMGVVWHKAVWRSGLFSQIHCSLSFSFARFAAFSSLLLSCCYLLSGCS